MRVLLDECLPRRLKRELSGHQVYTVPEMGWAGVKNGTLLRLIQDAAFDVFVTIDGNLTYQQNLQGASLAIVVLSAPDNTIESLRPLGPAILNAIARISAGEIIPVGR
jgi:predicted nuclease of predicted toxin-antitoxin system